MKAILGRTSKLNLCNNVDYRLVHIVCEVARLDLPCDFGVFESKRTIEKQKEYVQRGVSKTMNSKHIPDKNGIVRAIDIVPYVNGKYTWENKYLDKLIPIFEKVAEELYPHQIQFGKNWKTFIDRPHIEIKTEHEL